MPNAGGVDSREDRIGKGVALQGAVQNHRVSGLGVASSEIFMSAIMLAGVSWNTNCTKRARVLCALRLGTCTQSLGNQHVVTKVAPVSEADLTRSAANQASNRGFFGCVRLQIGDGMKMKDGMFHGRR